LRLQETAGSIGGLFAFRFVRRLAAPIAADFVKKNLRNIGLFANCHEPDNKWTRQIGRCAAPSMRSSDRHREMLRF
jgi:hypothetical protein